MITISTEYGFKYLLSNANFRKGWSLAELGQLEEGTSLMQQCIAEYPALGVSVPPAFMYTFLARTYGQVGRVEEGLSLLEKAFSILHKTGEVLNESLQYKIKGELLLQLSEENQTEAETCFHKAIQTARSRHAKLQELRAATSLSRLWQSQGKREAARDLLAPVYDWFTEGFDTADLKEAKALLEELT